MENINYRTVKSESIAEQVIEKSKFIGYLAPASSEAEAKEYLRMIKKQHPKATHHCSAYVVGDIERSNDDGEPSSSAGSPMLQVLRGNNMDNVITVVVRYYGGVLLGVGGLIRAYGSSVTLALDEAVIYKPQPIYKYELSFGYEYINEIETLCSPVATIIDRIYDSSVKYIVTVRDPETLNKLSDITRGTGMIRELGKEIELERE